MKIRISIPLVLITFCCYGCGQTPSKEYADYSDRSGFVVKNIDSVNVDNLVVLAKVWGFAKYHHPFFADSIYNIDYELFELLPRVAYASKEECNSILYNWVTALGPFKSAEKRYRKEIKDRDYIFSADIDWIYDAEMLSAQLSRVLHKLRYAVRPKPSLYASFMDYASYTDAEKMGPVNFSAESDPGRFITKDTGYNLLALFRFWNMVEYYFPYRNIMDNDWNTILIKYVPEFIKGRENNFYKNVARLIAEINDTHSFYHPPLVFGSKQLPLEFKFAEGEMVVNRILTSNEQYQKIHIGDQILSINGRTPANIESMVDEYISCSNRASLLRWTAIYAQWGHKDPATITFRRGGKELEANFPVVHRDISPVEKEVFQTINDTIGYLYPASEQSATDIDRIKQKMNEVAILIVDHRCYPLFSSQILFDFYLPQKSHLSNMTFPVLKLPGCFISSSKIHGENNPDAFKGRIIILVNEQTQSMGEYITMALQTLPGTLVIGSQTAGADGNIADVNLPGGVRTRFSGLGVYYPDGTPTQRVGIRIDHYVEPTIEGIKQSRDEVLEKALEIIGSELSKNIEEPENL